MVSPPHGRKRAAAVGFGAVLAATIVLALAPPSASSKEHAAACPELPAMIARVRAGLEAAASERVRGSSLAAYQILRTTAASMVRDADGDRCGALGRTLTSALTRAAGARTALDASVELDLGLDAALSLATDGHPRYARIPPKVLAVGEAVVYGQDCPDLFPLTVRLEGPPDSLSDRVRRVLRDLKTRPRCQRVERLLGSAAPERLAHAVDSIRLDEPDDAAPPDDAALWTRCPEFPLIVERLAAAISIGAPLYNAGDALACQRTYEAAVRAVTTDVVGVGRCPLVRTVLGTALARADAAGSANEAAWALRHGFDSVLSGDTRAAP
ncbi:MAG TPA: hypothetical protein VMU50_13295 [Polyangia bacterium]|nr:hypothetical protein [Polyangia bacterium]